MSGDSSDEYTLPLSRRDFARLAGATGAAALAGCTDGDDSSTEDEPADDDADAGPEDGDDEPTDETDDEREDESGDEEPSEGPDDGESDDPEDESDDEDSTDDDEDQPPSLGGGDDSDGDDGPELEATIRGERRAGAAVDLVVAYVDGDRVGDGTVAVDGETVGTTDENGRLELLIPADRDAFELTVDAGDADLQRTVEVDPPLDRDVWFDTAQIDFPVETYQYNPDNFDGYHHGHRGLFAPYAQYSVSAGEYLPSVAEEWTVGDTAMTIQLREDLTWSAGGDGSAGTDGAGDDGPSITAEDVVFQFDEVYRETGSPLWEFADSIEATDDYEVTIRYPEGTNTDLVEHCVLREQLDRPTPLWERLETDEYDYHLRLGEAPSPNQVSITEDLGLDELPTSGPLEVAAHTEEYAELVPRDDHPQGERFNWNGYRVRARTDVEAAQRSFLAGELDGMHSLFAEPGALAAFPDSLEEVRIPGGFGFGLAFNRNREPLQHREVRQAILHLIDREAVVRAAGASTKIHHEAPTGLTAASVEEWLGSEYADDFETYQHESDDDAVEAAEALLAEVDLDFSDLDFDLVTPAGWSDWTVMAAVVADQLDGAVDSEGNTPSVTVRHAGGGAYWEDVFQTDGFDLAAAEHTQGGDPSMHHPYFALRFKFDHDYPISGGEDPFAPIDEVEVDGETVSVQDLLDDLATTRDREEQAAIVERLAQAYNSDPPVAVLCEKYEQSFVSRDGWRFPDVDGAYEDHFHTYWPMWWLPTVDAELDPADDHAPGLLKAGDADRSLDPLLDATFQSEVRAGGTVELVVRYVCDGPASDATVVVDGETVGTTDADGRIAVDVPRDVDAFELSVDAGDSQLARTVDVAPSQSPEWFDTAQTDFPVETYQYNPGVFDGYHHGHRGLFAPYAQYSVSAGEYLPYFVEDWTAGDTEFVLRLREDLTWSTGGDITAEDVVFQFDTVLREIDSPLWEFADSIEATGEYEVTITYPEGTNADLVEHCVLREQLDRPTPLWSELEANEYGAHLRLGEASGENQLSITDDLALSALPSSGPLELAEHTDEYAELVPRDDHPHGDHFDWSGYRVRARSDNHAAQRSFVEGELDGMHSLFADPGVLDEFPDSLEEIRIPGGFGIGLAFNRNREPLQHREVRRAILHLIDREATIAAVGESTKLHHEAPTGLTASSVEEWLGADYAEEFETYQHEDRDDAVAAAEALLAEVDLDFSALDFELVVPSGWSDWVNAAAVVAEQLNSAEDEAGNHPSISVRHAGGGSYWEDVFQVDSFDLALAEHTRGGDPSMHHPYFSLSFKFEHDFPINDAEDPFAPIDEVEVDGETVSVQDLLAELAATRDREEQAAIVERLAQAYNSDPPVAVLCEKYEQSFVSRDAWTFPTQDGPLGDHLQTYWPQWWLPMVEAELDEVDDVGPGLLKAGAHGVDAEPWLDVNVETPLTAGEPATVEARHVGQGPAAGATVRVDGERVGETDDAGRLAFPVPEDVETVEIVVASDEAEVRREIDVSHPPDPSADGWFDTAQTDFPAETYQYNPDRFDGYHHGHRGLFAPYAQYSVSAEEYLPYFAEEWTVEETEMTIQLRDDFTWSTGGDGSAATDAADDAGAPITAEDVVFQFEEVYRQTGSPLWEFADSIEATDDYEVTISYPRGTNTALVEHCVLREQLDRPTPLWEQLDVDDYGAHLRLDDAPADNQLSITEDLGLDDLPTSGPLEVAEHTEDYAELVPRDDHPHGDHFDFDGYRVRARSDNVSAHESFVEGELDGMHSLFADLGVLAAFPDSLEEIRMPGGFGIGLAFNRNREPFQHREVRQAILHLIDREAMIVALGETTKLHHEAPTGLTASSVEEWLGADYAEEFETYQHEDRDDAVETAEALLAEVDLDFSDLDFELIVPAGWTDWVNVAAVVSDQLNDAVDSGGNTPSVSVRNAGGGLYWESVFHPEGFDVAAAQHTQGGNPAMNHPYFSLRFKFDHDFPINDAEDPLAPIDEVEVDGETVSVQRLLARLAGTNDDARQAHLVEQLAHAYNQDLPVAVLCEKYEQSFLSRDGWRFPDVDGEHADHFRTYWPQWWLAMVEDESMEGAETPGLLKREAEDA